MRRIFTLDLSVKRTGWASAPPDGDLRFGSKGFPSTGVNVGALLSEFHDWLDAMLAVEDPALVVFEAPILQSGKTSIDTARKLMSLAGHTEFLCHRREIRCVEQNIMTNKKDFTGSGRAEKEDMINMARRRGWDVRNDDEADACALWMGAVLRFKPECAGRFKLGALGTVRAA